MAIGGKREVKKNGARRYWGMTYKKSSAIVHSASADGARVFSSGLLNAEGVTNPCPQMATVIKKRIMADLCNHPLASDRGLILIRQA